MKASRSRKILVVTGKRGGFGAIIPTLKELHRRPGVEIVIVATDQHLYEDFGNTYHEVQQWFDIRHLVPMDQEGDRSIDRTKALSTMYGLDVVGVSSRESGYLIGVR